MRLEADVVKFFKPMGEVYQPRINRVLRVFMDYRLAGGYRWAGYDGLGAGAGATGDRMGAAALMERGQQMEGELEEKGARYLKGRRGYCRVRRAQLLLVSCCNRRVDG
ncbi:BrnA antitoxin family protein [Loktanella sp. Alg231-35]|uniref:BrnA antitoxin family protein n=1 Tax=Loktanella sp. Alg231-35 TaxID=1922220 RepID=UPI000D54F9AE